MEEEIKKMQANAEFVAENFHEIDFGMLSEEQISQIAYSLAFLANHIKIVGFVKKLKQ